MDTVEEVFLPIVGVTSPFTAWTVTGAETSISFTEDSLAALTALAGVEFTSLPVLVGRLGWLAGVSEVTGTVLVGVAGISGTTGSAEFGTADDVGSSAADDVGPSDLGVSLGCVDALPEELGVSDCDGSSGWAGVLPALDDEAGFSGLTGVTGTIGVTGTSGSSGVGCGLTGFLEYRTIKCKS